MDAPGGSIAAQFMANPGKSHVEFVKDIIKYMNGNADQLMTFTKRNDWGSIKRGALADIVGFFDSDFAADVSTRRSRTGWSVYIFGMPIGHKSVLQHSITLSTASAEFLAMCSLMQFMMWFVGLVQEIGFRIKDKVLILGDNRACMLADRNHAIQPLDLPNSGVNPVPLPADVPGGCMRASFIAIE
jgi:hypothetical protein